MEVDTFTLLQLMLMPFVLAFAIWLLVSRKELHSKWNLLFNKARTVKVNFLTRSGRNLEQYVKPDSRGMMHISGGAYPFLREASSINAKHRIPEVWVSESQPYPAIPDVVEVKVKTKVKKSRDDGTFEEVEGEIPGHLVSFHNIRTMKLAGKTAEEIEQMLQSKIINDIVNATSKQMQRLELMFYMLIGVLGLMLIGFVYLSQEIGGLGELIQIALFKAQSAASGG